MNKIEKIIQVLYLILWILFIILGVVGAVLEYIPYKGDWYNTYLNVCFIILSILMIPLIVLYIKKTIKRKNNPYNKKEIFFKNVKISYLILLLLFIIFVIVVDILSFTPNKGEWYEIVFNICLITANVLLMPIVVILIRMLILKLKNKK